MSIKQIHISVQTFCKIHSRDTLEQIELFVISNDDKEIHNNCLAKDPCTLVTSQMLNIAKTYPQLNNMKLVENNIAKESLALSFFLEESIFTSTLCSRGL